MAGSGSGSMGGMTGQQSAPSSEIQGRRMGPTNGQFAPLAPRGSFNVNNAAAGGLQQAMQGTQAAGMYSPQQVNPTGYNAANVGSQGYNAANVGSQGYNAANVGSQGYNAANVGSQGYNAATVGGQNVAAQNVQAGQLSGANLSQYTNPFEDQVVQQSLDDLDRSRMMAQNKVGAQAGSAGAFGGSRHGIAEAETNRGFADQAARTASGLRQTGFQNAQNMAGQDISMRMQGDLANQGANLQADTTSAQFVQQAKMQNQASRNQANQFGAAAGNQANMANFNAQNQANQFGAAAGNQANMANFNAQNQANQFGASAGNQANMANFNAQNQANQFGAAAGNQANMANFNAQNQANQFGASAGNQARAYNQAAQNQAGQYNAGNRMQAQSYNQNAGLQANQQRLGAASQMGGLGNQAFNTGQTLQQNQRQQGLMQQGLQQSLIDAAQRQFQGYANAPLQSLGAPLTALGSVPDAGGSTTTEQNNPGLFDYLGVAGTMGAFSDSRLKTDVESIGSHGGVNFYKWAWNSLGRSVVDMSQPTVGVMADELQETHPHLVMRFDDGFLRVNYRGLSDELMGAGA